jgi:hypothetical protein
MNAPMLLETLQASGVLLEARGDRLHIEAPQGTLNDEMLDQVRQSKAELLALLSAPQEADGRIHSDPFIMPTDATMGAHWKDEQEQRPTHVPLLSLPDPLPPVLEDAAVIIGMAQRGELERRDASLVLTAAIDIARIGPTEETAERLPNPIPDGWISLMLDISEVEYRYNPHAWRQTEEERP